MTTQEPIDISDLLLQSKLDLSIRAEVQKKSDAFWDEVYKKALEDLSENKKMSGVRRSDQA